MASKFQNEIHTLDDGTYLLISYEDNGKIEIIHTKGNLIYDEPEQMWIFGDSEEVDHSEIQQDLYCIKILKLNNGSNLMIYMNKNYETYNIEYTKDLDSLTDGYGNFIPSSPGIIQCSD